MNERDVNYLPLSPHSQTFSVEYASYTAVILNRECLRMVMHESDMEMGLSLWCAIWTPI